MSQNLFSVRRVNFQTAVTLVLGLLVTYAITRSLFAMEKENAEYSFHQRALSRINTLQNGIDGLVRELQTLNKFLVVASPVTKAQFSSIAKTLLTENSKTKSFLYQKRVKSNDLASHNRSWALGAKVSKPHYTLTSSDKSALAVNEYLFIDYIEPLAGNTSIVGTDVLTNPFDAAAHKRAILSGLPAATPSYPYTQGSRTERVLKLVQPVYEKGAPISTLHERQTAFVGETAVQLQVPGAIASIIEAQPPVPHVSFSVYESTDDHGTLLYENLDKHQISESKQLTDYLLGTINGLEMSREISFADQTWRVVVKQTAQPYLSKHLGSTSAFVLGTLFSILASSYVNMMTKRTKQILTVVETRTLELKSSNSRLVEDNAARKKAEDRANHIAQHDVLTGLANRVLLHDRLEQAIARGSRYQQQVWVVFIDLDRFKSINDSLGHSAGDELICEVGQRLKQVVRETDSVARFGGDEFVMLISEEAESPLDKTCLSRIMDAIEKPIMLQGHDVIVTASVGVSVYPDDSTDPATLIGNADLAMYRAKKSGRNNVQFYTAALNEKLLEKLKMERALRDAITREQFVLHFQPQVNLKTGRIVGAEALIRWDHPTHGMIAPADFITLAEDTGLIAPIGDWVLREACICAQRWHNSGYPDLKIGVNVSARQFSHTDLVSKVRSVLKETKLNPMCLDLELTESSIMSDVEKTISTLTDLKTLGVKLSIDDFGTGYSSLAYLQRFPLDVLKIDQSFVQDIQTGFADSAIVASVIGLSHNLKLQVIAEGVETSDQLNYLKKQGCDEVQGYYFSKPLSANDFEEYLRLDSCTRQAAA